MLPYCWGLVLNCAYIVQVWRVGLKLNGLGHKDVEDGLAKVMTDKEMDNRLIKLRQKIMGMQGDGEDKTGTFMLKAFVEYLNKPSSTTIHENSS
ncbi:hypothetical protein TanjilG_04231 [Lupinus angustifolius]|uniref:Uncharacterized protein n=1 Tax=Lupinus angustifolius TaxID=3871 RepID=A0A4P1RP84_LUPAN|nr:hypothetical protein TanjilG_04231 [Lupinus angustifolius]